eukprot:TRINITY_DN23984_c0_g1_i1.p1 TRINITY_DN23984_c0_g1~~TRINITY_DN23984_c0_g1_i1.p1  ORF type:complete len:775 (+),score=161.35 TRINITY_DN23984_c0_g1_i1:103-2325(+)
MPAASPHRGRAGSPRFTRAGGRSSPAESLMMVSPLTALTGRRTPGQLDATVGSMTLAQFQSTGLELSCSGATLHDWPPRQEAGGSLRQQLHCSRRSSGTAHMLTSAEQMQIAAARLLRSPLNVLPQTAGAFTAHSGGRMSLPSPSHSQAASPRALGASMTLMSPPAARRRSIASGQPVSRATSGFTAADPFGRSHNGSRAFSHGQTPLSRASGARASYFGSPGFSAAPPPVLSPVVPTARRPLQQFVASVFFVAEVSDPSDPQLTPTIPLSHPPPPAVLSAQYPGVGSFCFADLGHGGPCRFTFCITDSERNLLHGHALRVDANRCLCYLSEHTWHGLFDGALHAAAEALHASPAAVPTVVRELLKHRCPPPRECVCFGDVSWRVPKATARFPWADCDVLPLFSAVGVPKALLIVSALIREQRVLFVDDSLPRLCSASYAACALLCPLEWPHTFVPVVPPALLDAVCAPTPWIFGVHASCLDELQRLPVDTCLCVDLRSGELNGYEPIPLPGAKELAARLQKHSRTAACLDIMLGWFAETFGEVRRFVRSAGEENGVERLYLDSDALAQATVPAPSAQAANLLRDVAETTTFHLWIQRGMRGPGAIDAYGEKANSLRPDLYAARRPSTPTTGRRRFSLSVSLSGKWPGRAEKAKPPAPAAGQDSGPVPPPPEVGKELLLWTNAGGDQLRAGTVMGSSGDQLFVIFSGTGKVERVSWKEQWTQGRVAFSAEDASCVAAGIV